MPAWGTEPARLAASATLLALLIWLSVIDLRIQRLPDRIVLPALWSGLALNAAHVITTPADAILGAILGYLSLWFLSAVYSLRSGAAMGGGDLKTAAMIGAWLGASALPVALMIAFVSGTCTVLPLMALGRCRLGDPIPFGPALAFGAATSLLGGPPLERLLFGG